MTLILDSYGSGSGGEGDIITIVERDRDRTHSDEPWLPELMKSMRVGSAGVVVVVVDGYRPYLPHVGTSTMVNDRRERELRAPAAASNAPAADTGTTARQAVLQMSSADQALELLAALSLNKSQLAEVLGVSRPTLYDWLEGKEPNDGNAQRLRSLVQLLARAGVTAAAPLSPRFVRVVLEDGQPSLLELMKADSLDLARLGSLLAEAKLLEGAAEASRLAREDRLRALGFEEPTDDQRRENLALNVALRAWPQD